MECAFNSTPTLCCSLSNIKKNPQRHINILLCPAAPVVTHITISTQQFCRAITPGNMMKISLLSFSPPSSPLFSLISQSFNLQRTMHNKPALSFADYTFSAYFARPLLRGEWTKKMRDDEKKRINRSDQTYTPISSPSHPFRRGGGGGRALSEPGSSERD